MEIGCSRMRRLVGRDGGFRQAPIENKQSASVVPARDVLSSTDDRMKPPASVPRSDAPAPPGLLAAAWGLVAIVALLGQALWRLIPIAWEPLHTGQLTTLQAAIYAAWVSFTAYSEGYRGFQKSFSPSCAARAVSLARAPTPLRAILAPAYVMSLFAAPRRRIITSWLLVLGISALVALVRALPQPWRGIIDGGVVVGLGWGVISLIVCTVAAFRAAFDSAALRSGRTDLT
jgi:hypothetical protein